MRKIIRVEKPKGEVTRWSLFIIYFEDDKGKEYPSYQTPEEFKVTMLKQKLLSKGFSEKDLSDYENVLRDLFIRENSEKG
jgi:hypothetical protein